MEGSAPEGIACAVRRGRTHDDAAVLHLLGEGEQRRRVACVEDDGPQLAALPATTRGGYDVAALGIGEPAARVECSHERDHLGVDAPLVQHRAVLSDAVEDPARLLVTEAQADEVGEVVGDALREAEDELAQDA
eukprot:5890887-Heterocapsa_arctica.AAC.1